MEAVISKLSLFSLLVIVAASIDDEFMYNGFRESDLHLDGISDISPDGLLRMTNTTKNQQGHAFHKMPLLFKNRDGNPNSFSTTFVFAIHSEREDVSGQGLALVLSPTRGLPGAPPIQYLGLFNPGNNGNSSNHVIAVEFDTIFNIEFGDIDNNHVGIDVNGLRSIAAAPASYYAGEAAGYKNFSLFRGETIQVWVEYDSLDMKFNVTISPITTVTKPSFPLLSSTINLSSVIYDTMYVGFSSSSGSVITSHYVLGWSFKMSGQAPALNLSALPSLPPRNQMKNSTTRTTSLILELSFAVVLFVLVMLISIGFLVKRKMRFKEVLEDWEIEYRPHRFSYKDLYKATKGFRNEEVLGVGGFGRVYRGKLPTSKVDVAVKRVITHDSKHATREFIAEIVSVGRLCHRNLVQLLGYCRRNGELLLVYEFMSNGSLDKFLFTDTWPTKVNWRQRFQIIRGVASGLFYLHEEWEQVVLHRDIKAGNVLLDGEMNGKLGDFGLSRLYDHGSDPRTTHVVGTMGYIAPELTRTGRTTPSTDVFAFGVFMLEMACGRRPIEQQASPESLNLVDWVRRCWRRGCITDSRDPKLGDDFKMQELELVLKLGLICSHPLPAVRPSMRQVLCFLDGDLPVPELSMDFLDEKASSLDIPSISSSFASSAVFKEQSSGREPLLQEENQSYYVQ
ncbi:hypothetical protein J5N97_006162 [Dioscorea zingiberensis]|uniref:non-specific serine/threonine protein kinase n=1 Tax=Dioscorea zingiberensis TaxID=325984 RepID=A0A9D5D9T1_9LILI|nr:hypothetical protein J5N97_006162 [Dioscorea zingiberensis]